MLLGQEVANGDADRRRTPLIGRAEQEDPLPGLTLDQRLIQPQYGQGAEAGGQEGMRDATTSAGAGRPRTQKIPSFPCHFAALGLKARHVRGPRTPGGLP